MDQHTHAPAAAPPPWHAPPPAARARLREALRFDKDGLVPAIAQQWDTGEVLMLAWMNAAAVEETLATGRATYWSRSRAGLWRKGDTSGQVQRMVGLRLDCDADAVLLLVDQLGVACHTGRRSCFSWGLKDETVQALAEPEADPKALYAQR